MHWDANIACSRSKLQQIGSSPTVFFGYFTSVCMLSLRDGIIFFFQDLNETSITNATGFPDLTKCFQVTVLVWIPCGYLLTVAPCYIWSLVTSPRSYIRHTWLNVTKTVIYPTVRHCILLSIAIFSATTDTLFFILYHAYITIYTLPFIRYCSYV